MLKECDLLVFCCEVHIIYGWMMSRLYADFQIVQCLFAFKVTHTMSQILILIDTMEASKIIEILSDYNFCGNFKKELCGRRTVSTHAQS